ncbi:MAG: glycosyltransferase family 2 protein [Bryobacteraceae bacterium]|nr:glycosyltransferase family 2 protein [Bryobacteraceae bacterium]
MKVGEGISAFFPAYNDAPSLPGLLRRAFEALDRATDDFEVIVVNDGSRDETAAVLERMRAELGPRLRIVTHERNRGYGGALRSGFAAATKELVFYTDGDGQYDPAEIHLLLEKWSPDVGLVNGYKRWRQDPWHRVVIGHIYNRVARFLFRIRIRDIDCDFRLIRRALIQNLELESTSGTICLELVRKIEMTGCGVAETAVSHYPRLHGRSQFFRWRSLASTARQFARLYWKLVVSPNAAAAARAAVALCSAPLGHRRSLP